MPAAAKWRKRFGPSSKRFRQAFSLPPLLLNSQEIVRSRRRDLRLRPWIEPLTRPCAGIARRQHGPLAAGYPRARAGEGFYPWTEPEVASSRPNYFLAVQQQGRQAESLPEAL